MRAARRFLRRFFFHLRARNDEGGLLRGRAGARRGGLLTGARCGALRACLGAGPRAGRWLCARGTRGSSMWGWGGHCCGVNKKGAIAAPTHMRVGILPARHFGSLRFTLTDPRRLVAAEVHHEQAQLVTPVEDGNHRAHRDASAGPNNLLGPMRGFCGPRQTKADVRFVPQVTLVRAQAPRVAGMRTTARAICRLRPLRESFPSLGSRRRRPTTNGLSRPTQSRRKF